MAVDTSLITVYDTVYSYNVTAGVGPFNASLVQPFLSFLRSTAGDYPYEILPYTYFAAVYTLVLNPLITTVSQPVSCRIGDERESYLLSGGLEEVTPWVPQDHNEYPLVKIDRAAALQLDFTATANDSFQSADCEIFGETGFAIGIRLCVVEVESIDPYPGTLRAGITPFPHFIYSNLMTNYIEGLFVCLNGTDGDNCQVTELAPNITTILSGYTRQATIVAARSNYSIVSVLDATVCYPFISYCALPDLGYNDSKRGGRSENCQ